ncbi:MAG: TOMM precursor leader peptide-binding protein [Curvibacter sp.]|nr:TOMM precursor leader peptide-binding protein [Curvibacter sp.]
MNPAPNLFDWVPGWHPRWRACRTADPEASLVLMDEMQVLQFRSPDVDLIADLAASGQSLNQRLAQGLALARVPGALHAMEGLRRQGYLGGAAEVWHLPDFSLPWQVHPLADGGELYLLSTLLPPQAVLDWCQAQAQRMSRPPAVWLLCDDYLDPRLDALWQTLRARGTDVLLFKAAGLRPWVGPWLDPRQTDRPCWHCLSQRLRRNQPARGLLASAQGGLMRGLPLQPVGPECLEALSEPLARLSNDAEAVLLAPDGDGAWQRHHLVRRPQCPECGEARLQSQWQRRPVRPGAVAKAAGVRGGARPQSSESTVQQLMPHVGPLCGVVASFEPIPRTGPSPLTVYRSSFFRTPSWAEASPDRGFVQLCLGKGLSEGQAQASALCEAVERYAACLQGDEAVVRKPLSELDAPGWGPGDLAFFSPAQAAQAIPQAARSTRPEPLTAGQALNWVPAWSLSRDAACYLPQSFCYAGAAPTETRHIGWTSNGCASGNRLEDAIWQGFLELVERDATAVWWYNEIRRPPFGPGWISDDHRQAIEASLGPDWDYWLLDITHDMGLPVAAAVGQHRQSGDWALGFGAAAHPGLACERALTELLQLVVAGKQLPAAMFNERARPADFLRPDPQQRPAARTAVDPANARLDQDIADGVRAAARLGLEVLVHDYSRPDIPLRSVKVVMPGACHIWPELANSRLYEVPVRMGWRRQALSEAELNPVALFV